MTADVIPFQPDSFDDPAPQDSIDAAEIFGDDAGPAMSEEQKEGALATLIKLCEELQGVDAQIAADTVALAEKQGRAEKLRGQTIPELMEKIGLASFVLKDGTHVDVKKDIKCSLSEERKPEGLKWIRDNNFGAIIKTTVGVAFGKGEEKKAAELQTLLSEKGFLAAVVDGVHPQTLKSFVKERIEKGDKIPLATFGVFEFKKAEFSLPKASKKRK